MARFSSTGGGSGSGTPGPQGPQGPAGDSTYDIAVENGFVGTEQEWLDSFGGTANIADFVFNYDEEDTNSTITIHNHDMVIQTTRDGEEDSDISLNSADDIWMNANDDIEISASNSIYLNGTNGVYLGTTDEGENNPNNQVATIGDIQSAGTGDITFIDSTISNSTSDDIVIQNKNTDGIVKARITLDQGNEQVLIEAIDARDSLYTSSDWLTATWSGNVIEITDTENGVISFFTNGDTPTNLQINDGQIVKYDGGSYGSGNITMYTLETSPEETVQITSLRILYGNTSKINIDYDSGDFEIRAVGMDVELSSDDDVYITAGGDDLFLRANDDIRFVARYNEPDLSDQSWIMNSEGEFHMPGGGYISNPINSSGDGYGNDTIELVPDQELSADQRIIIDPTSPNHIHIRAGGPQDNSQAYLILGGERTHVQVSDQDGNVRISSKQPDITYSLQNVNPESSNLLIVDGEFEIDWNWFVQYNGTKYSLNGYYTQNGQTFMTQYDIPFETGGYYNFGYTRGENVWNFSSNGTLYGPEEGSAIVVTHIVGEPGNNIFNVIADQNLVLKNGEGYGAYLDNSNDGLNQIATMRDLPSQSLEETDSPSFNQIYVTNNNGTGENVKIGDDAWIGDLNQANYVGIVGAQDPTVGGIILGNSGTETIAAVDGDVYLNSGGAMTLNAAGGDMNFYMDGGMYIGDSNSDNQIIKRSDLNLITPTGITQYSPVFSATGLTFTGSGTTYPTYNSSYVKVGNMVTFTIEVDLSTVTNFGTGQYKLQLPFPPAFGYNHFSGWANVDTAVNPDVTNGHVILNVDHAGLTDVLDLHYLKQAGGAHTPIIEGLFLQGTPVTLTTSSKIYVNGTYISA